MTVETPILVPLYSSILITGANGMLAHAMQSALKSRGHDPILLTRAQCDIADGPSVSRVFETHRPTLLINCAAYTKVDLAEEQEEAANAVNGTALEILAREAKKHGARIVHFSTDFVFDGSSKSPYKPSAPTNPLSAYGRSKLLGETLLGKIDPPGWLTIRTAWLYGTGGPCFPNTMLTLARKGVPLRVVSDQIGSPTLTTDLARATLELLDHDAKGTWHIGNSGQTSWFDFTQAILNEFGVAPIELSKTTSAEWKRARPKSAIRPAYSVLDTKPYEELTGRPMPDWRDALRRYRSESTETE